MKQKIKPKKQPNKFGQNIHKRVLVGLKNDKMAFVESLVVAILSLLSWFFIDRESGNTSHNYFFWPMLGPILISLRYGFSKGFQCFAFLTVSMFFLKQLMFEDINFSLPILIGSGLIIMITGEFTDYWRKSIKENELNYIYMEQKLQSFTQSYYLLKISHDQLEQRAASKIMSLRTSIQILQKTALTKVDNRLESLGDECLHILSDVVGMYEAGIYLVKDDLVQNNCISAIGKGHSLVLDDPMLLEMLDKKRIFTPANIHDVQDEELHYQLVIPLVDSYNKLQGVVLAEKVKFVALTDANLALISLVASYMANFMCEKLYTPILKPEQGKIFNQYLEQLHFNKLHYGADSALVIFVDKSPEQTLPIKKFIDYRRGADIYWNCFTPKGEHAMVALLPMTTVFEAKQFIDRLLSVVKDKYDADVRQLEILGPYVAFSQSDEVTKVLSTLGEAPVTQDVKAKISKTVIPNDFLNIKA
ncbi:PelD GGDEF domain-containing protein [Pseudocolwellia sp. AS88]|uniref:PelD GGDEF domain-containing protein n=1 Tax=Pseudocolwellia sp. AS88 TaxID=3063958 RepID=UPI0026F13C15|nr:PelD GGDEF domain-containing protein [Pseudocolwellia sp. AS88]MDO7084904.1 PelD GGDEF domain-containing protein [Pseudocolwellia sp. AS88]